MGRRKGLNKNFDINFTKWWNNQKFKFANELSCIDFINFLKKEVKCLTTLTPEIIVNEYKLMLITMNDDVLNGEVFDFVRLIKLTRDSLAYKNTCDYDSKQDIINIYFNTVKREYIRNPLETYDIEVCAENRDLLIRNNLKLVINCAKRYTGMGVPIGDLIQAGNIGLCVAFDKFDNTRGKLRNNILNKIKETPQEIYTYNDAVNIIEESFIYGKNQSKTIKMLPTKGFDSKLEFEEWIYSNIKPAVFASVAFQWIRAYIMLELNNINNRIKMPKNADKIDYLYLDKMYDGSTPNGDASNNQVSNDNLDDFVIEDNNLHKIDIKNAFDDIVDKIFTYVSPREKRLISKKFGIGIPYPMEVKEIAEFENLTNSKVNEVIKSGLTKIRSKMTEKERKIIEDVIF